MGNHLSQSPSLRGSGRFAEALVRLGDDAEGFNPLHCGAVVASIGAVAAGAVRQRAFQSPSLRGSGRFRSGRAAGAEVPLRLKFQSPSLRGSGRFIHRTVDERTLVNASFNPLHCGAVVASLNAPRRMAEGQGVSIPFIAGQWSLPGSAGFSGSKLLVSIPFIAGQWSLR